MARTGGATTCSVCHRRLPPAELTPAAVIRPQLAARIAGRVPGWSADAYICHDDLGRFREEYVEALLREEIGEIERLERSVVERIARHETLSSDVGAELARGRTPGERVADRVAAFGGSWRFIGLFALVMAAWMGLNSLLLAPGAAFDPYPFILLNLVLSCLAAVQAPVIMMSQNRQEARDRAAARNDYLVNLKAELEVRLLHEKLDHLLRHQWERLAEIQQVQIELMRDLGRGGGGSGGGPRGP